MPLARNVCSPRTSSLSPLLSLSSLFNSLKQHPSLLFGLRSPSFVVELGFIPELLRWFASVAIPVSLVRYDTVREPYLPYMKHLEKQAHVSETHHMRSDCDPDLPPLRFRPPPCAQHRCLDVRQAHAGSSPQTGTYGTTGWSAVVEETGAGHQRAPPPGTCRQSDGPESLLWHACRSALLRPTPWCHTSARHHRTPSPHSPPPSPIPHPPPATLNPPPRIPRVRRASCWCSR